MHTERREELRVPFKLSNIEEGRARSSARICRMFAGQSMNDIAVGTAQIYLLP